MPWTIKHNPLLGIIEISFNGLTVSSDLTKATSDCISLGNRTVTAKILVDSSRIELAVSITDLLNLPDQYVDENADRSSHVALILPMSEPERGLAHFYETACVNRGWFVRGFTDRQRALDWLFGTTESNTGKLSRVDSQPSHLNRPIITETAFGSTTKSGRL